MGAQTTVINYANRQVYTGSVKNTLPQGKGKLTFKNGFVFEGNFEAGSPKNGRVKNGQFAYDGELNNGELTGMGTLIDRSNTLYEGKFNCGTMTNGTITKKNSKNQPLFVFKGDIQNIAYLDGTGTLDIIREQIQQNTFVKDGRRLEGTFMKGNLTGKGTYIFKNGDIYTGQFKKGSRHGSGQYQSKQFTLNGLFEGNSPDGQSSIQWSNGDKYEGQMKDGQMHGFGKYTYSNGIVYEGALYYDSQWGQCKITYPAKGPIERYEGEVSEGLYNGIGTLFYSNGVIFKGYFLQGAKNGFGVLIYGSQSFKCLYLMNQLTGQMKLLTP